MPRTLNEKLRDQWIAIAVLAAAAWILRSLNLEILPGILGVLAALVLAFSVVPTWIRLTSGMETGDEAAARTGKRDQSQEKLAALEQRLMQAADGKTKRAVQGELLYQCLRAYQKSSAAIPNGPRPVELEDGDFALLARQRYLMKAMLSTDPKLDGGLAKDIRRIDEGVAKWRRAVEEVRAGTRHAPDHVDAEDYLRRLDAAFSGPQRSEPQ